VSFLLGADWRFFPSTHVNYPAPNLKIEDYRAMICHQKIVCQNYPLSWLCKIHRCFTQYPIFRKFHAIWNLSSFAAIPNCECECEYENCCLLLMNQHYSLADYGFNPDIDDSEFSRNCFVRELCLLWNYLLNIVHFIKLSPPFW
jgi:hypothetical protein